MDNKRTIVLIAAFGAAILLWMFGLQMFARWQGWNLNAPPAEVAEVDPVTPEATTRSAEPDLPPPAQADAGDVPDGAAPTTQPAAGEGGLRVVPAETAQNVVLGSAEVEDPRFALQLQLSAIGAGIDEAVLNDFSQAVGEAERYSFEEPYVLDLDATRPLATRSIQLLGDTLTLNDVPWNLDTERTSDQEAVYFVDIARGDETVARVEKRYRLFKRDERIGESEVPHRGFEVLVRETIYNRTGQPLRVRTTIQGPTTPPRELETGYDRSIIRGTLTSNGVRYDAEQVESFDEDDPQRVYDQSETPMMWAGTGTIYFNAIVRPLGPTTAEGEPAPPAYIERVVAEAVNPGSRPEDRRVALRFVTEELEIAAGSSQRIPLAVFLGPKQRNLLGNEYYSRADIGYQRTLVSPFGCTWCVFQPVVDVLVLLLSFFQFIFRDWGLAIIGLVVLVRTLLHPITKRSQKNMMRMSKLAPKLEQIKKKYGDDREKMAQAMAEIAPEQTQALLFGCLPMLLQTPIWIALYSTLQATFELRHAPFLYGLTWIDDLARPDHLIEFDQRVNLITWPFEIGLSGINLLPLLMGVVFYLQIKLQPQPVTAMSDEQKRQQKMIQAIMVGMFPIFLYSAPSGLNLYILTSTTIGIIETKLIRRNLKEQEEAEAAAEAEAARSGKKLKKPEPPKTGLAGRFARMREEMGKRIEEAQREAQKRAGERKK